jgi:hypothetical protein
VFHHENDRPRHLCKLNRGRRIMRCDGSGGRFDPGRRLADPERGGPGPIKVRAFGVGFRSLVRPVADGGAGSSRM